MFFLGSYRLENANNIKSIPDTFVVKQNKQNSIVYVVSDTLFSKGNNDISPDMISFTKKLFTSIIRQSGVFNNVEAIVLNGNIVSDAYNNHVNYVITKEEFAYKLLESLVMVSKSIPIYYVRGSFDCFINTSTLPVNLRGVIKLCNSVQIGNTLFIHGHNSLPFITDTDCTLINSDERMLLHEKTSSYISRELGVNVVVSNSNMSSHQNKKTISVGSFSKVGMSVISLEPFVISKL